MNKQELGSFIADLQSAHDDMNDTQEFDVGVCDIDDNCYDVEVVINRMDLNENCKNTDGNPYPAELMLNLTDGIRISYDTMEDE